MTIPLKISSGLRHLISGKLKKLLAYDTTMYEILLPIKTSFFMCFPSVQPVLFTLGNYVKVVPSYIEARVLYSYALKKMIPRDQMY